MIEGDFYMEELLQLALKKIDALEKKLERYYFLLKVENELDFVLKGTYLLNEDLNSTLTGNY